jgi:4-hydroxy-3-methylbut-2-enyl diphosphate reductase
VAVQAGARTAHLIDYASEIDEAWLTGADTVGVTSGASVPELLVQEVVAYLAEHGWSDVQEVTTANEKLAFALPRELRKDLGGTSS